MAVKEGRERESKRERESETRDLSTRILSRQLLSARGVNVIGRIIANHPVCMYARTYVHRLPLEISWGLSTCTSRALCQIDSANLLSPPPEHPRPASQPLFCILRQKIHGDLTSRCSGAPDKPERSHF